jgi:hypothetical protein
MNKKNLISQSAQPVEILWSNDGNDFLFSTSGNDELDGGAGRDTAVYSGTPLDYDIWKKSDGSWSVRNVRGAKDAGSDTLKNIEVVQFDNGKTYELKKAGLTFQTDFALVIDTTGSMYSSIASVKAQASSLVDAVFADNQNDGRIGVVGFKDTTNGEPSEVILPFTDQDDFADRKSAAIAAINGITVNGGGDLPETSFDGLRVALDGSMGQWRFGAGALRIAQFTDAPAKDGNLAYLVTSLASNIGATVTTYYSRVGSGGSIDTFNLAFGGDASSGTTRNNPGDPNANPDFTFVLSDDPITAKPATAQVQIFTIFTGPSGVDTSAFKDIAGTTGGDFFTASTRKGKDITATTRDDFFGGSRDEDLVSILLKIINLPPVGVDQLTGGLKSDTFTEGSEADTLVSTEGSESLLDNFDRNTDLVIGTNVIDNFNTVTAANITKVEVVSALPSSEPGWNTPFLESTVGGGANLSGLWLNSEPTF